MPRYSTPQPTAPKIYGAPAPTHEGDDSFLGLNLATDRGQLAPGYYARGENVRVLEGVKTKRPGSLMPAFCNAVAGGVILGSGVYSNPNGDKLLLIATAADVWKVTDGGFPTAIGLPEGTTLSDTVEFSQQFDKVLLHQSSDGTVGPTLVWNGTAQEGFKVRVKKDPLDAESELVPDTPWSINFGERELFPVPDAPDSFGASLIGDYSSWVSGLAGNKYRANTGTADKIVGLFGYAQGNLIVGKTESIDLFANFGGNLSGVAATNLAGIGVAARRSWQMLSPDAIFLSRKGVYRIQQVLQDRIQASPTPVAAYREGKKVIDPIGPLLRRINWRFAHKIVSGIDGPYYVLAFPLDDSPVNNALAILNTVSDQWESLDTFAPLSGMQIDNLLAFDYQGEARLYAVNNAAGTVHLLSQGKFDKTATGRHEIADIFETRGYAALGWNMATAKAMKVVKIPLATWRPSITIQSRTERANDVHFLTTDPITKRPWIYEVFGKEDYVLSNINNDAEEPGREDYSVTLAEGALLYMEAAPGIDFEKKQESVFKSSMSGRGRWISFRIASSQGDCDVLGVYVESAGIQRETRVAA